MGIGSSKIKIDEPKMEETPQAPQVIYEPHVPYGPINYVFWLDYNIDSEENEEYLIKMDYEFGPIQKMKEEQKLFEKIKELKFEIYIIIYALFVKMFPFFSKIQSQLGSISSLL